ncbi:unnamed protein product [Urochloa humidicola]
MRLPACLSSGIAIWLVLAVCILSQYRGPTRGVCSWPRAGEPAGNDYMDFFKELSPIECVQSRIKMVVFHEIYGDISEVMFIKYITQRANELKI